ncbi:hypothetical protein DSO57_1034924 [Entomophthora muscae]|uniref:Uncharacterized protein n=1 Tax=Entomophthora muscae TaxID=34485 RepID=A0ACC2SCM9_9FUNG|nr:hypothetical protein DSO57_1034924 [Entomophthora muscae]
MGKKIPQGLVQAKCALERYTTCHWNPENNWGCVMNDISILVLKTKESNPDPQKIPCTNQDRQGPTSLPFEPNPGPQEIPCPNQKGWEPTGLPEAKNESSIPALKTLESNPDPLKTNWITQDEQGPANLLSHRLKLLNYSATRQLVKGDSQNGHWIAANLVPLRTQTYAEAVACFKEVKTRPTTSPTNEHQLPTVSSPEWAI